MGHWRDGGIGNMAGSDDRPVSEWTLLERLNNLAAWVHQTGATARDIEFLTQEAANEIERLRPAPEPGPPFWCGETMTMERVIDLAEGMPDLAAWLEGGNVRYMKWVRDRPVYCDKEGVPVERPIRSAPSFCVDI